MNHQERRQEQRDARRRLAHLSARTTVTVHCRIVNRHIPIGEALAKHEPGSSHCFSCGHGGDKCQKESGHLVNRG